MHLTTPTKFEGRSHFLWTVNMECMIILKMADRANFLWRIYLLFSGNKDYLVFLIGITRFKGAL